MNIVMVTHSSGETDAHAHGPSSVQKALFDAVKRGKIAEVRKSVVY